MSSFHAVLGSGSALATSLLARQGLTVFPTSAFANWSSSSSLSGSHRLFKSSCRLGFRGVVVTRASHLKVEAVLMERRCAIITGVARAHGIGRHLVYGFLEQGYNVVGVDVVKPKEEDERIRGENFHFVQADVGVSTEATCIVQETVERYGKEIHVLINNAAKLPHSGEANPIKEFTDTIAVNLNGAYYLSQAILPHMPPGNSSIVHMSSTLAHQSEPDTAGYSASKAGLCGLTHSQAITLAGQVRVNAVLPGWINTDEVGETALRPADHAWHPVKRVGVPQDVVEMCLFLCDEKRAGFITGQEFVVDGGVSKKMVYPE